MPRPIRFFLVALGMSLLLGGMFSGLLRLGVSPPQWVWRSLPDRFVAEPLGALVTHHGGLMIGGFIGTVISLERAVALGRPWCFLGPLTAATGGWMMVWIEPAAGGIALITCASAAWSTRSCSNFARLVGGISSAWRWRLGAQRSLRCWSL